MIFKIFFVAFYVSLVEGAEEDKFSVAFQWTQIDYNYPSDQSRLSDINSREFIQENILPVGLDVHKNRLFVTLPRWKPGIPASLAYIHLNDNKHNPKLNPYPDWESHKNKEIVSPFRVRVDRCDRLWVLDSGISDLLGSYIVSTPQLLIYNLNDDKLIRKYPFPADNIKDDTFFANLVVEDEFCDDTYAYFGDLGAFGLVVYSFKTNESWRKTHLYFYPDPLSGEFHFNGINFQWIDGIFGLGLGPREPDGDRTLYFHSMTGVHEFSVSTKVLKDRNSEKLDFYAFKILGTRGLNGQSSVSFLHQRTGVLFYALVNLNSIACWNTFNKYVSAHQGVIYMNNETMQFPNDIKVDQGDNIWILSDRLPFYMYSKLEKNEVNFRILTGKVDEIIEDTMCDKKVAMSSSYRSHTDRLISNLKIIPILLLVIKILF